MQVAYGSRESFALGQKVAVRGPDGNASGGCKEGVAGSIAHQQLLLGRQGPLELPTCVWLLSDVQLLACHEYVLPHTLDPATLGTQGQDDLNGDCLLPPYTSHSLQYRSNLTDWSAIRALQI